MIARRLSSPDATAGDKIFSTIFRTSPAPLNIPLNEDEKRLSEVNGIKAGSAAAIVWRSIQAKALQIIGKSYLMRAQ